MQPCRRLYGQLPVFMCKCVNQKNKKENWQRWVRIQLMREKNCSLYPV